MSTILVVDDDTTILSFIDEALNSEHQIFTSETVYDAESITRDNDIDLLITDLVMPDKNGLDMIMAYKKDYPDTRILAISGGGGLTGRFDYLPIAKLVGAADTLKKPFTVSELRHHVNDILELNPD